ncbi:MULTISPECIES: DUF4190 domain-containing protein [Cytobacillus]|uniref:DUF4190 domain-containing protein n=1 Tax=Cytobacillus TaxID=2675230 RepID=UPI00203E352A|nr:DUF4190 domain-containing protein [Cytobacillus kochii]MCM3324730.1 DUF4190 domain-containing protein [Cytobacillus kochii]MCM3347065.1 DUF4190 domain-containing protein [Cytobacillus kochii]MDM5205706.1 DUF4190 domain-containing protein [Cytobacillus kochii]
MSKVHLSLILGILSIITPYIGLVIGIFGSIYASKLLCNINGPEGRKLISAGKVCSVIGIFLHTILLILLSFSLIIFFLTSV